MKNWWVLQRSYQAQANMLNIFLSASRECPGVVAHRGRAAMIYLFAAFTSSLHFATPSTAGAALVSLKNGSRYLPSPVGRPPKQSCISY